VSSSLDFFFQDAYFHLFFVSAIAVCALIVAVVSGRAGARAAHYGPVWLAVGCLAVGILMLAHGLTTPGVYGRPINTWVGRLPYLSISCFALAMALASRPRNRLTSRLAARHPRALIGGFGVTLTVLAAFVVVDPTRFSGTHEFSSEDTAKWMIMWVASFLLVAVAVVHLRRWRLGHDPVQYALMLAGLLSTAALVSLRTGEAWHLSWWDYHGFLLAGYAGAVYAVWVRFRRTRAVDQVLAATFEDDPMTHIVSGYPDALKTLVHAVEVKDRYTHGHSERTAKIAVQLGIRLGLDENKLRALARGAYLHDVGKIAIPDSILNKPATLTSAERTVVETHPQVGYELVVPVAALREALPVVLHHHERWDGTGYPRHLEGQAIPLIARVAAIADVWDAMTSDRSYRRGLAPAEALAHIEAGRGTHFDPRLVDGMVSLAADWGYSSSGDGDAAQAALAAETCHDAVSTSA
jgi:HD-GYP domain-containing protein (c-di-GMP phosphodiesterase class II)